VGVGEEVKQGDTIATAGAIDSQQAGGLYFELRYKGRPVDPVGWLEARR
jgi:septal ring factor EnvC (AmiA/AmiB activator)